MTPAHSHAHERGPLADASVRTARSSDLPAVGLVQATVFRETYVGALGETAVEQFDPSAFAAIWRDSLQHPPSPAHRLLVALAGDQVVGLAAVGPADEAPGLPEGCGEISVLAVHPEARRQGHGSRLVNAAADTLRAHDHAVLLLWVPAELESLRAFLSSAGLEPDGAWRDRLVDPAGSTLREVRVAASL